VSPRRPVLLPLLAAAAAAVLAGCGGAPAHHDHHQQDPKAAAPSAKGLTVAATDLRLGDATAADDRTGTHELRVGDRRVDPDALRQRVRDRAGVGAGASCPDAELLPDTSNLDAVLQSTFCLINGERIDAGLVPLTQNAKLAAAALKHTDDMVANQYFAHVTPDGVDLVARVRPEAYIRSDKAWMLGENLGWGTGSLSTPRNMVAAWMASQGHRENILRPQFREIGLGILTGNPRGAAGTGATYTTVFGTIGDPDARVRGSAPTSVEQAATKSRKAKKAAKRRAAQRKARDARTKARTARRKGGKRRILRAHTSVGRAGLAKHR